MLTLTHRLGASAPFLFMLKITVMVGYALKTLSLVKGVVIMKKSNKTFEEIIHEEMIEFVTLVMKYSPSQLTAMSAAVDLDNLQNDMVANGATREDLMTSSECHHDIHEAMRMWGIHN